MTALQQATATQTAGQTRPSIVARSLVAVGTILVIVTVAILPLLTSTFIHPALDAAAAADAAFAFHPARRLSKDSWLLSMAIR